MKPIGPASCEGKNALGWVSVYTTVFGSVAFTELISATFGAHTHAVAGSLRRIVWSTTACALNGVPSVNVMPLWSLNVHVLRSLLFVQLSASTPAYLPFLYVIIGSEAGRAVTTPGGCPSPPAWSRVAMFDSTPKVMSPPIF